MTRFEQIKELLEFNLNTTLNDMEITRHGTNIEGDPNTVKIMGRYGFGKSYNLEYEYNWLKDKQDAGELTPYLLEVRENIIRENN